MAKKLNISFNDLWGSVLNNQETVRGTSVNVSDVNTVYLIFAINGASGANNVTLKDVNGNTVKIITEEKEFIWPIRLDYGFQATGSSNFGITFGHISGAKI